MKKVRVGIVGFGFMGRTHAYGYINLPLFYDPAPAEAKMTLVCDSRAEAARQGAAMLGAEAVTDFRRITENPEIDVVDVCTPNHMHADVLLSAMAAGKHVYCDKPLTATWEEAERVEAALRTFRGTGQMALQNRFFPSTMRARQLIEEGFLGRVLEFTAAYLHAGSADPNAPLKWKLSAAAGGGVVADLGTHLFDLVHWLLGDYARLSATTHIAYPTRPSAEDPSKRVPVEAEDSATVLTEMQSGAVGTLHFTKLATGAEDEVRVEIHGSKGALRFNGMDPHHVEIYDATAPDKPQGGRRGWTRIDAGQRFSAPATGFPGPKFAIGWLRGHLACQAAFLQAVCEGKPGNPGLEQGVLLQRLVERTRDSARTKQWVSV